MAEERFSLEVAPDSIERACNAAFSHMDERVRDALTRGLALHQVDRPNPAKLERLLPLDRDEYEYRLVSEAVQECLRLACECGAFADHALADESGRDFIDALDAFNAGRYGEAVPILRAQAVKGNAAATYYLGVCARDGLGVDECDLQQAAWLFSEAAEAGNMLAQKRLRPHALRRARRAEERKARGTMDSYRRARRCRIGTMRIRPCEGMA
ncbi:SEL1-like repeat protein [uncultured Slackia sp.]|uniref:SEL1-like repeat protein n=1 Tax=uncultured Slackia sp. TaxID=665903 RepID=UPI0028061DDF|nr:SEL1-like repeat protein [uncultured Slackia sp.]